MRQRTLAYSMFGLFILVTLVLMARLTSSQTPEPSPTPDPKCPLTIGWRASEGDVDYYEIKLDDVVIYQTGQTIAEICIEDDKTHKITITAHGVGSTEETPLTSESSVMWYPKPPPACAADFDGDGWVDGGDFGTFSFAFGKCCTQAGIVACPE